MNPTEGLKTDPEKISRQRELRHRRELILDELKYRALTDAQELELTREMRKIQNELNALGDVA